MHRPENRSLHRVNEDSRTELTLLGAKRAIFRDALIPIAAALLVTQIMYSPADPYTKRKDFFRRTLIGTYSMMDMAGRFGFNLVICFFHISPVIILMRNSHGCFPAKTQTNN
jgi:hypothetical protein